MDFAKAVCEGECAQKKLQQLMKKYDIEESDLSDDKLEDHEWKYHNDFELGDTTQHYTSRQETASQFQYLKASSEKLY